MHVSYDFIYAVSRYVLFMVTSKKMQLVMVHLVGSYQVYLEAKNKETTFAKVVCFEVFLLAAGSGNIFFNFCCVVSKVQNSEASKLKQVI